MLCCILTLFSGCKEDEEIHFVFTTVNMKCPWVADVTLDWKAEMVILT